MLGSFEHNKEIEKELKYTCNICKSANKSLLRALNREEPSCTNCHSNVRYRSLIHLLSVGLFGKSLALPDFPNSKKINGIGLSDWTLFAKCFEEKFNYKNTFYDKEPNLDIMKIPSSMESTLDFIVCSEVFEHVVPPIKQGFLNLRKLLRKNGILVFSVPFSMDEETVEYFPFLHDWKLEKDREEITLVNIRKDGAKEIHKNLVFHGGPGLTLEMRLFSKNSLINELKEAGFKKFEFCDSLIPEWGIHYEWPWSIPLLAKV